MSDLIRIDIQDKGVKDLMAGIAKKAGNKLPLMRKIAGIMHDEVEQNFEAEGRPKWKKSISAAKRGGKTLQDTGQLASSINERATDDEAVVGTNKVYGAAHQFGMNKTVSIQAHTRKVKSRDVIQKGPKSGRGHKIASGVGVTKSHTRKMNLPARPFLSVSDGGMEKIKDAARDYLLPE